MKFNSSKLITSSLMAFVICVLITACHDETATKTTGNGDTPADSLNAMGPSALGHDTTTVRKKKGRASVGSTPAADANAKIEKDKMGYYNYTEVLPAYIGGQNALDAYITGAIEYPQQAIDNNTEGTITVQFAVDEQGTISNVTTIGDKKGDGLEEEAVRVVTRMPKWSPGQIKGKNVKTWRILPITYKLES